MALKVLLTNDDGPESPLIAPFAEALAAAPWCEELRVVVPAQERSWIAKAITKFDPLTVKEHRFGSVAGHVVATAGGSAGTPADCVELGLWNLYSDRADLVVSGINVGVNAGRAFVLSSGTVGGTIEGLLNQVPGLALSATVPREVFAQWTDGSFRDPALVEHWQRVVRVGVAVCGSLIARDFAAKAKLLSINLPWAAEETTPVRLTRLKETFYKGVFEADPERPATYRHRFRGLADAPDRASESGLPADLDVIARGEISVSAFDQVVATLEDPELVELVESAR